METKFVSYYLLFKKNINDNINNNNNNENFEIYY